jgi:putative intracellular protease/amidase
MLQIDQSDQVSDALRVLVASSYSCRVVAHALADPNFSRTFPDIDGVVFFCYPMNKDEELKAMREQATREHVTDDFKILFVSGSRDKMYDESNFNKIHAARDVSFQNKIETHIVVGGNHSTVPGRLSNQAVGLLRVRIANCFRGTGV